MKDNTGQVSDLALQTGAVAIHIKGTYQLSANAPVFDLKLLAQGVPIDGLQALMPAVGVKLPNNAGKLRRADAVRRIFRSRERRTIT